MIRLNIMNKLFFLIKIFIFSLIICFKSYSEDLELKNKIIAIGSHDATVKIKVFSSFTCPHCANFHFNVIPQIKEEYVEAAQVLGFANFRILTKHVLPNILAPVIVISAANFASAILIEAGLSFLGIGAQPPIPSWGTMIKDHYSYIIMGKGYLAIFPGLAIMLLVLSFMLLGNAIRDAFDVKN